MIGVLKPENHFDLTIFDHAPIDLMAFKETKEENKFTVRAMEKALRDAGLSHSKARALVSGGYNAAGLRDEDKQKEAIRVGELISNFRP